MTFWSINRINALLGLTENKNYLEIGVEQGHTFAGVVAELKYAVDPKFQFELIEFNNGESRYFETTSDDFFAGLQKEQILFDVIFLDGFHEFSQTYRDLVNSLNHLAPGGFILVDDVYPNDEFSFYPNQEQAYQQRALSVAPEPLQDYSWHGDIFKVIAIVHDYHQRLSYRTFFSNGSNPQTVIWREYSGDRPAKFYGLNDIASLKYQSLQENMEILNIDSDEGIFTFLAARIGSNG